MTHLKAILLVLLLWPSVLQAQDRDVGLLVGFLEDQLSSTERTVRIDGFSGALSARATIERLTIADGRGDWLVIEDAELDWNRAAVLRGDIQIKTLSAGRIDVIRRPDPPQDALPAAAATPFSLPDLPVAISIDAVTAPFLRLGEGVIAPDQPALELSISGSATLGNGAGALYIAASKLTGVAGQLSASASYDDEGRRLALDLSLAEDRGGLLVQILNVPETPSIALSLKGDGPIDDFQVDLELSTNGDPRLVGTLQTLVDPVTADRSILADVSGDLTPLFDPELGAFFGQDLSVKLDATRAQDGALDVHALHLTAEALAIRGTGQLDADGWPVHLNLDARIQSETTELIRLPVPGPPVKLATATAALSYDRSASDALVGAITATRFSSEDLEVDRVKLDVDGLVSPQTQLVVADVVLDATGIAAQDPKLVEAIGDRLLASLSVRRVPNEPLRLDDLLVETQGLELAGSLAADNWSGGIDTSLDISVDTPDLARFTDISGRQLGGRMSGRINGTATLFSGAFDVDMALEAQSLSVDLPQADALLEGTTKLNINARRDGSGLDLRAVTLASPHASLTAQGRYSDQETDLSAEVEVASLARVVPGFPGQARLSMRLTGLDAGPFRLSADVTGPGELDVRALGSVQRDFQDADIALNGTSSLALANPFLAPRVVSGQSSFELALRGPMALESVTGQINLQDARLSDPSLPVSLLGGRGSVSLNGRQANLAFSADGSGGGTIDMRGPIGLSTPFETSLDIGLSDLGVSIGDVLQTTTSGRMSLTGALARNASLTGAFALGPTEVRLATFNSGNSGGLQGLRHINEPAEVRQTRAQAGFIETPGRNAPSSKVALDLSISAPNRIFVRGRGLDAELGGAITIRGDTTDIQPDGQFSLIRGRLDLLGQRLDLTEGSAVLEGGLVPRVRLLAVAQTRDITLNVLVEGSASEPELIISSDPDMPQDAALAQFLFGRGLGALSPLQTAQLARALVTLTGDGSGGVLDDLRARTGLDDLDITSGPNGQGPALRAGKYISENIYSDVILGANGSSSITLNLDVSPSVTLRGTAQNDGGSGLGVFFERDY